MASCSASGPGRTWQKFSARTNSSSSSHFCRSTTCRCISPIWPTGPPKASQPSLRKYQKSSLIVGFKAAAPWPDCGTIRPLLLVGTSGRVAHALDSDRRPWSDPDALRWGRVELARHRREMRDAAHGNGSVHGSGVPGQEGNAERRKELAEGLDRRHVPLVQRGAAGERRAVFHRDRLLRSAEDPGEDALGERQGPLSLLVHDRGLGAAVHFRG